MGGGGRVTVNFLNGEGSREETDENQKVKNKQEDTDT